MFPARSTWTIGSPSVRCASTMTLGANTIPPVDRMGFGVGPPGVKKRLACPLYPELKTRNGTTRTSYVPEGDWIATSSEVVPPAPEEPARPPPGPYTYRSKSLSLLGHSIRIVTWPVFEPQNDGATSTVRKKWSHTRSGSGGGHSSGRVVAARTKCFPVHAAFGVAGLTVPIPGVAPRAGTAIVPITRLATIRAIRGTTNLGIGHLPPSQTGPPGSRVRGVKGGAPLVLLCVRGVWRASPETKVLRITDENCAESDTQFARPLCIGAGPWPCLPPPRPCRAGGSPSPPASAGSRSAA